MTHVKMFGIAAALSGALVLGGVHPAAAQVRVGVGVSVALPAGHAWVEFGNARYAYYDGGFYRPYRMGRFMRVAPPIGAVLTWLPDGARLCYYDGYQYFVYDGVWYEPEYLDDGTLVYVVVEIPYGARMSPYSVYYYPGRYVLRPVPFRGVFLGLFFRNRYVDRDYFRSHRGSYRGLDRYDGHYASRGRSGDGYGNRDGRSGTRQRVQVPPARVTPQPRPAQQPRIRQGEPRARQAQPGVRQGNPRARQAQPRVWRAQPQARQAQPRARQAQPRARQAQPRARQAQPRARQAQPRARQAQPRAKARPAPRRSPPARGGSHRGNGHHGGGS